MKPPQDKSMRLRSCTRRPEYSAFQKLDLLAFLRGYILGNDMAFINWCTSTTTVFKQKNCVVVPNEGNAYEKQRNVAIKTAKRSYTQRAERLRLESVGGELEVASCVVVFRFIACSQQPARACARAASLRTRHREPRAPSAQTRTASARVPPSVRQARRPSGSPTARSPCSRLHDAHPVPFP